MQILKLRHAHVDRAHKNARVRYMANSDRFLKGGRSKMFPEYYKAQRLTLFGHILRILPDDPMRRVTFLWRAVVSSTKSCGQARPCMNWTIECYSQAWQAVLDCIGRYSLGRHDIQEAGIEAADERRFAAPWARAGPRAAVRHRRAHAPTRTPRRSVRRAAVARA